MISVIMLDLGDTLTDGVQLFPFVPECLEALSKFVTSDGQPVDVCLVSDFEPAEPFTEDRVAARFSEYLGILESLALRVYFEPVGRRVTLSTHVDTFKPDRKVFSQALVRLSSDAELSDCLFITENRAHISAGADLGMSTMPFGDGAQQAGGFDSWPEGLVLIARAITPDSMRNLEIALGVLVKARHGLENLHMVNEGEDRVIAATAQAWIPMNSPELEGLDGVNVPMPVSLFVTEAVPGLPEVVISRRPSQQDIEEAHQFIKSLIQHQQIEGQHSSVIGTASHYVETDVSGRRLLKRRGFQ